MGSGTKSDRHHASEQPAGRVEAAWRPQDGPQTQLLRCPVFEVFFGGARGGGKTDGMLGEWVSHAAEFGESAIGLMVRRELTQLVETIERSKQIYSKLGAVYHEQAKMWRFPNGARLRFAYLERDSDADAYQGHSYSRVYFEEIGTFPSPVPVLKLMATLRSGTGAHVGFRATGNPGGPGHHWVKARYIDPAPLGNKIIRENFKNPFTGETVARGRVFIPSKISDNRYLGSDYVANLQMQASEELVRAWLLGDWTVIAGAFFPEFSIIRHVRRPFPLPSHWLRFRSGDWGSAKPFSIGWWAVADGDTDLPRGCLVRYREWYGSSAPNVGLKLTAEQVADGIVQRSGSGEKISYSVLDPAAFSEDGGPSIAERMHKRGATFRPADNARVAKLGHIGGWDLLRHRLIGEDERPMIVFFDTCRDIIRTLPTLQHDPDRPEDLDTDSEDHAADEVRYACASRPWVMSAPKPKPILGMEHATMNHLWKNFDKKTGQRGRIA